MEGWRRTRYKYIEIIYRLYIFCQPVSYKYIFLVYRGPMGLNSCILSCSPSILWIHNYLINLTLGEKRVLLASLKKIAFEYFSFVLRHLTSTQSGVNLLGISCHTASLLIFCHNVSLPSSKYVLMSVWHFVSLLSCHYSLIQVVFSFKSLHICGYLATCWRKYSSFHSFARFSSSGARH